MIRKSTGWVIVSVMVCAGLIARSDDADQRQTRRSNQEVADSIGDALRRIGAQGYDVEIEFQDGTAKLSGRVETADGKRRILAAALGQTDVDEVIDSIVVGPPSDRRQPPRSNQEVAQSIADAIVQCQVRGYEIEIRYQDGTATLSGHVDSADEKSRVLAAAADLADVDEIIDSLVVGPPSDRRPPPRSNQEVAQSIAEAIAQSQLSGYEIEIRYQDGTATLSGQVKTADEKRRVLAVTADHRDVDEVIDSIVVDPRSAAGVRQRDAEPPRVLPAESDGVQSTCQWDR